MAREGKKNRSTLYRVRVALQAVVFPLITLLFLDFTGSVHRYFGWLAKIQFLPAVLALHLVAVAVIVAITLLFGRIYCSVICPLGILQDIIAAQNHRKNRYSYSPEKRFLRYGMLVVFLILLLGGVGSVATLLAPYSAFGRIASSLLQPIYIGVNNLLAMAAEHYGSYAFYRQDVWLRSVPVLVVAVLTLLVVGTLAWRGGRTYCNTICPVGTVLSLLARFSLFRVRIDTDKCRQCSLCTKNCKASAIDFKNGTVDASRCVSCGTCLNHCNHDAISFSISKKTAAPDTSRRAFLTGAALATAGVALAQEKKKVDGGLAVIEDKVVPHRNVALTPPGSLSADHFAQHCTACQLCVSVCPNGVLRPSTKLQTLMQPTMQYERGYCRPECVKCGEVCPTAAIKPITAAQKTAIHVGHAVWVAENCVPMTDGVQCGNCARHCPVGAIQMVPIDKTADPADPAVLRMPVVDEEKCIGCGACEHLCPSRPLSAIYVEGHEAHRVDK